MVAPIKGIPMPNQLLSVEVPTQPIVESQDFKKKVTKKSKSEQGGKKAKEDDGAEGRETLLNITSSVNVRRPL